MSKITGMAFFAAITILAGSCKNGSRIEQSGDLIILHLEGSPYERGLAHGALLKQEIHKTVSNWKAEVERAFDRDFNGVVKEFFMETSCLDSIKKYDPDILREVKGISESANIDYNTILAFQMSEELEAVLGQEAGSNCTSLGISKSGSHATLLGQNMDPPMFLHGHPFVMHILPDDGTPQAFLLSVPGFIGLAGVNENGIAITCTGMSMLNHSTAGLPVACVVRSILSRTDPEDAYRFLETLTCAVPQCFTVGGPEGNRCFECSANQTTEFYPFENPGITLHTNFAVTNRDFNPHYIEVLQSFGKTTESPYFCPRFFRAYDKIEEYGRNLDVQQIESILRLTEPDLEPILNQYTLGTIVMELDADPTFHVAMGNDDRTEFHQLKFEK